MKRWMSLLLAAVLALSLAGCSEEQSEPEQTSAQTEQQQTEEPEETQQASETEPTEETEQPEEQPAEEPAADEEQPAEEPVAGEEQPAEESTETETEQSTEGTAEAESSEAGAQSSLLVAYFSYAENAALPDDVDASASASIQPWNGAHTGNTGVVADMIAQATGADLFSIRTVEQYPDTYDATLDQGQQEQQDHRRHTDGGHDPAHGAQASFRPAPPGPPVQQSPHGGAENHARHRQLPALCTGCAKAVIMRQALGLPAQKVVQHTGVGADVVAGHHVGVQ